MPVAVSCACGKSFNVKDELIGSAVNCQLCGAVIEITPQSVIPSSLSLRQEEKSDLAVLEPSEDEMECPFCAEIIKRRARKCRHCGETISRTFSPSEIPQMKQNAMLTLDAYLADPGMAAIDEKQKGSFFAKKTIVLFAFDLLSLFMIIYGSAIRRNGEGFIVVGIFMLFIFGLATLVSFFNDLSASKISESSSAKKALKRWYNALKTGRAAKAFVAVAPAGRVAENIGSVTFDEIPENKGLYSFSEPASFAKYWKSVFRGPSMHARTATVSKIEAGMPDEDGFVMARVTVNYTSYPTLALLGILVVSLLVVVLIFALQKRETQVFNKLLLNRDGRWYIVEGQYQGEMDIIAI